MSLEGKGILITGGGSGIGLASARLLVEAGARVVIAGRNREKLEVASTTLNAGERLTCITADVSDAEQATVLVAEATQWLGSIDILVNNAGANIKARAFRELTPESWQHLFGANLNGAFYCMRAVLPQMLERRQGLIININSVSGKRSNPIGGVAYNAAKFALRGLAMGVAAEEREQGIRVSSIYPGEVDTPILLQRPNPLSEDHRKRILQPEDVAKAVLFVASLPPRATVPELVITPALASYV